MEAELGKMRHKYDVKKKTVLCLSSAVDLLIHFCFRYDTVQTQRDLEFEGYTNDVRVLRKEVGSQS